MFCLDAWEKRWIQSTNKGEQAGKFVLTHGKFYGDAEKDLGKFDVYIYGWVPPLIAFISDRHSDISRCQVLCPFFEVQAFQ